MGTEIERKFLVCGDGWRQGAIGVRYRQGYIPTQGCSIRVRTAGDTAYLSLKVRDTVRTRTEYEYTIPLTDADEMLGRLCTAGLVEKTRYRVPHEDLVWEIDVFEGANAGLIVAEVELASEDQAVALPEWVGEEVTHDERYLNTHLAQRPYCTWAENRR